MHENPETQKTEISARSLRDWIVIVSALLTILGSVGHYLISTSPNSPVVSLMQSDLAERVKTDVALQNQLTEMHEQLALMKQDFERRISALERERDRNPK